MGFVENIDKRIAQIYFEEGIKLVLNRWLPWDGKHEIMFKSNGIECRGIVCTTSATKRTKEESTTE